MKHLDGYAVDLELCPNLTASPAVCLAEFFSPMIYRRGLKMKRAEFGRELLKVVKFMLVNKHIRIKDGRWCYLNRKLRKLQREKRQAPEQKHKITRVTAPSRKRKKQPRRRPRARRA